jgi:hypothetical protein
MVKRISYLCLMLVLLGMSYFSAQAQSTSPLVMACITPMPKSASDTPTPYLIEFGSSSLFGFVVPQDSNVTLYTTADSPLSAALYSLTTNAQTGGYLRQDRLTDAVYATHSVAGDRPCNVEYPDIITENLLATLPLPVSLNHAILVQVGTPIEEALCDTGTTDLECKGFLATYSIHFRIDPPLEASFQQDFQIIQLRSGNIDVSFPFLSQYLPENTLTRIIVVGNKDATLTRQFLGEENFVSPVVLDKLSDLVIDLSNRLLVTGAEKSLDLFELMKEGFVRIFPKNGRVYEYPVGGFLRFVLNASESSISPAFAVGCQVKPIEGTAARYYIPDRLNDPVGELTRSTDIKPAETAVVDSVTDQGLLQVVVKDGRTMIVESWLVEVIPGSCPPG